jgi:hypothetical protein
MKTVTGMGGMGGARELAEMLRQMGRGPDTVLAHITPEEAEMLMQMGGSGNMNPNTGLPEFQPYEDYEYDAYVTAPQQMAPPPPLPMPDSTDYMAQARAAEPVGYYGTSQTGFNQAVDRNRETNFQGMLNPRQQYDIYDPANRRYARLAYTGADETSRDVTRDNFLGLNDDEIAFQQSLRFAGMQPGQTDYRADILAAESAMQGQPEVSPFTNIAQTVEGGLSDIRQTLAKYPNLSAALATGAQSLPALLNARKMQRESERSAAELRALGAPLRQQGEALRQQALAGRLTPQQAAAQEAARARLRQGGATRGVTTGTQQAMIENQLASSRAAQSEVNLNNALKQLNLANAYDEAAIRAKLAGDRELADSLERVAANFSFTRAAQKPQNQPAATPQRPSPAAEEPVTRRPEVRS